MLQDLHILDLLELAGSQAKAGQALAMHQSTVCRSLRLLQQELRLEPVKGAAICRHGHNNCLNHLRLAYRAHRLMEGVLRLGSDALHHSLISRLTNVQQVPPRFRSAEQWAQLIRHGLLDGALLSSLGLEQRLLSGQAPPLGRTRRQATGHRGIAAGSHQPNSQAGVAAQQGHNTAPASNP
jgi:hypothetical protein